MSSRVTIAIPVYKRLNFLPETLQSVDSQDYPNIDVIISDNGLNGSELESIVDRHCTRPYRLRRNPASVGISEHFNQLVEEADGEYFVLLSDDDYISPNYISRLVQVLEQNPEISVALTRVEVLNEAGDIVPDARRKPQPPEVMAGDEFVRIWCKGEYKFVCFVTNLARTKEVKAAGGYPILRGGTSIDNALLLKLSLDRQVAFVPDATFYYRVYESSQGLGLTYRELAADLSNFIEFLDSDEVLRKFARKHPRRWRRIRGWLVEMTWRTYSSRWRTLYRSRLPLSEWIRAAFAMPFIPAYYRAIAKTLLRKGVTASKRRLLGSAR